MKQKNGILFLSLILISFLSKKSVGQTEVKDTIHVSRHTITNLVFHDPILRADFGSEMIVSNGKKPKVTTANGTDILSIKARKKFNSPTNISVVTAANKYYNIHCFYNDNPKNSFYHFGRNIIEVNGEELINLHPDSIDEEVPIAKTRDSVVTQEITKYYRDTIRYKGVAKKLYSDKIKHFKNFFTKTENSALHFLGIYGVKDKLHIKLSIGNGASLPFRIGQWEFSIRNKGGFDIQEPSNEVVTPIYEHNSLHQSVLPKHSLVKIFVFEQFTIDKYSSVYVQLKEKEFQRTLVLEIPNKYINRATSLKLP